MLLIPGENMFFICMIVIFQGLSFSCQLKALREWAVKEALVHKVFFTRQDDGQVSGTLIQHFK